MAKPDERIPEKQCIEGICQFCGRDGYYDEEKEDCREDLQEGWLGLFDTTVDIGGVYGEWCCRECFRNDLLCQTAAENLNEYENKKNELLKHLGKESSCGQHGSG